MRTDTKVRCCACLLVKETNLSDCCFTEQDQLDTAGWLGCAGISHDDVADEVRSVDSLRLGNTVKLYVRRVRDCM